MTKLYKPSEANVLFDGASLLLYVAGITVYVANIVKGLRVVTAGTYGVGVQLTPEEELRAGGPPISREDSLRVVAASNTILALVLVGVLVLQAGQWYAQRKDEREIEEMKRVSEERRRSGKKKS